MVSKLVWTSRKSILIVRVKQLPTPHIQMRPKVSSLSWYTSAPRELIEERWLETLSTPSMRLSSIMLRRRLMHRSKPTKKKTSMIKKWKVFRQLYLTSKENNAIVFWQDTDLQLLQLWLKTRSLRALGAISRFLIQTREALSWRTLAPTPSSIPSFSKLTNYSLRHVWEAQIKLKLKK